ncbi:FAD-dependent oxidoreductase [Lysobacter sp. HDW10]|uniref:FAD-dependent oxidoreductase n=1 Tax=Lysobacter sp. HDW10 TaxID=2714936 RepID=UPI00140B3F5D|nr:FAD-dependent oxidoreductase [Lysobacter sp. HDW10]QIK81198.1 FAD-dependent oxidoreductase [Lysobacter sp. HDW10]
MSQLDVVVVGGGVVGACCALALSKAGLRVAIVEANAPATWHADSPDLRVFAFAPDNQALFEDLGVWQEVSNARAHAYRHMHVWDALSASTLSFDADRMGTPQLGWIIENALLIDRLWQALDRVGIETHCPERVESIREDASGVRIRFESGRGVDCRVAIAADGGNSKLRELAGIAVNTEDYEQRGLVAYLSTERAHEDTAFQRFLPEGPLALLPVEGNRVSIVWTLPQAQAEAMSRMDEAAFNHAVTRASDRCLGDLTLASDRASFPLRRQLVDTQIKGRILVIGDAAHVVHPLAGQGVNLGLRDVSALLASVRDAAARKQAFDAPSRLARWARHRKSDNVVSAMAFETINKVYRSTHPLAGIVRGTALGVAGKSGPLKRALWRHAAGI